MEMDDEFLETNDLDWFASFQGGLLAHFATGGRGFLPAAVRKSIVEYEIVYDYFYSLSDGFEVEIIESNLPSFSGVAQRDRYLRSFVDMAKRGLLSYDVNSGGGYDLIARPRKCREYCSLPDDIKEIICVLPVAVSERLAIDRIADN